MQNTNKTNAIQKRIMIDFMLQHPELARNIILNGRQGKKMASRLWGVLTANLNAAGPPVKDVKMWRKVYADQKHQVKKKISSQRASFDGSMGNDGACLKRSDQQIIQAAGLDNEMADENPMPAMAREDPNRNHYYQERFDIVEVKVEPDINDNEVAMENGDKDCHDVGDDNNKNGNHVEVNEDIDNDCHDDDNSDKEHSPVENMVAQLNEQFQDFADDQKLASAKLDRLIKMNEDLIKMKERSLQMKEEQHAMDMALKRIDLEIKTIELKGLKTKRV